MAVTNFSPSIDTYIAENASSTNYKSDTTFQYGLFLGKGTNSKSGYLEFDLSTKVRRHVRRGRSLLKLTKNDSASAAVIGMEIRRVTETGCTADMTWDKYDGTNAWTTAGAVDDVDSTVYRTFSVVTTTTEDVLQYDVTALVRKALQDDGGTVRMLIQVQDHGGSTAGANIIHSQEASDSTQRPILSVVTGHGDHTAEIL